MINAILPCLLILSSALFAQSTGININLDSKLKSLLQVEKDVQLTYFNLQHYLSRHYIKDD